ncbi:hypothetical protein A0H81_05475 [Grifola frondosa]|uniref:Uncharacterized protein n=1 Tax=Grifola frondosa TaxID=5627 RepID=A0A1C7MF16_GRIFR|nr:hypothetical protein A0H81_05475 [Grifola frondosa]
MNNACRNEVPMPEGFQTYVRWCAWCRVLYTIHRCHHSTDHEHREGLIMEAQDVNVVIPTPGGMAQDMANRKSVGLRACAVDKGVYQSSSDHISAKTAMDDAATYLCKAAGMKIAPRLRPGMLGVPMMRLLQIPCWVAIAAKHAQI